MIFEYHQEAFDLLKIDNRFSTEPVSEIPRDFNARFNDFPSSVKEWLHLQYTHDWWWKNNYMEEPAEILEFYSNNDPFFLSKTDISNKFKTKDEKLNFISFSHENQGNYTLAFEVQDGLENPPVYISENNDKWNLYFNSFSEYVYSQIFDYQFLLMLLPDWQTEFGYSESIEIKNDEQLQKIIDDLIPGPSNQISLFGEPLTYIFRYFKTEKSRLIIYKHESKYSGEVYGINALEINKFHKEISRKASS